MTHDTTMSSSQSAGFHTGSSDLSHLDELVLWETLDDLFSDFSGVDFHPLCLQELFGSHESSIHF